MTTLQEARSFFSKVQQWDVQAGKLFGNADHIRATGTSGWNYGLTLACRVLIAGIATTALMVMLLVVAGAGDPRLLVIGVLGSALILLIIPRAIYPTESGFDLVFPLVAFIAAGVGVQAAQTALFQGTAAQVIVSAVTEKIVFQFGVPLLIIAALAQAIMTVGARWVEKKFPDKHEPRGRDIQPFMTLSEQKQRTRMWLLFAPFFVGVLIMCLSLLPLLNGVREGIQASMTLLAAGAAISLLGVLFTRPIDKHKDRILSRLESEGILQYTSDGYVLNGVAYPKGRAAKSESVSERR